MMRSHALWHVQIVAIFISSWVQAQAIVRGPYLQNVGSNSATVMWFTDIPSASVLRYKSDSEWASITSPAITDRHIVELEQLAPNLQYTYQLISPAGSGDPLSREFHFKTAPLADSLSTIRLAVLGDSGSGDKDQLKVAEAIKHWKPDLMLHVGDIVYPKGEYENYDARYFLPYAGLIESVPVFPALGNHDLPNLATYLKFFLPPFKASNSPIPRYYSFNYGPLRITSLDSNTDLSPGCMQRQWLLRDLESAKKSSQWKIVFLHHPPFSAAKRGNNENLIANLVPLLERAKVNLVLSGHDHAYQHIQPSPISSSGGFSPVYVVTGGGGMPLYPQVSTPSNLKAYYAEHHFLSVLVTQNSLDIKAIAFDGRELDSFQLHRP